MINSRQLITPVLAVIFASFSVWSYVSISVEDENISDNPTDYASDVFTRWESVRGEDGSLEMVFSRPSDDYEVVFYEDVNSLVKEGWVKQSWRSGVLMGTVESLAMWEENPGEMAGRWKPNSDNEAILLTTKAGWKLMKPDGSVVVWARDIEMSSVPMSKFWGRFESLGADKLFMGRKWGRVEEVLSNETELLIDSVVSVLGANWDGNICELTRESSFAFCLGVLDSEILASKKFTEDSLKIQDRISSMVSYSLNFHIHHFGVLFSNDTTLMQQISSIEEVTELQGLYINSDNSDAIMVATNFSDRTIWMQDANKAASLAATSELDDVAEEVSVELSKKLLGTSRNHRSAKDMDILWDEDRMVIEAVETGGRVVWSKELKSAPFTRSFEVDLYSNNKYQTAFSTPAAVFLIDINGRNVAGYPYKPTSVITGFSVVDYDKNEKYRFLVATKDGKIRNLKDTKQITPGWMFSRLTDGGFVRHMSHLRIGQNDYVYVGCNNGSVMLLSRSGEKRVETSVVVADTHHPSFRLGSSINNSTVLFIDDDGWLQELTFGEATLVGMSGLTRADSVSVEDVDGDGKKEIVVMLNGVRSVWNSRNEKLVL